MKIILNGEEKIVSCSQNVRELINDLKIDVRKVAVEKNMKIVPRSSFDNESIHEGDEIEIIHFIGGG